MRPLRRTVLGHEFLYALRIFGLRDRYRCPDCGAVGSWKPHGGFLDGIYDRRHGEYNTRLVRRWVCKFCGHYEGPEGTLRAHLDSKRPWWVLPEPYDPESVDETYEPTPQDAMLEYYGRRVWPWRG